jgi:hypothetical protein
MPPQTAPETRPPPGREGGRGSGLAAWFAHNRTEALIGGGLAAAGLAVTMRKRAAAKAGSTAQGTAAGVPYDSVASDVYNSMEPQIEALQRQLTALRAGSAAPFMDNSGLGNAAPNVSGLAGAVPAPSSGGLVSVQSPAAGVPGFSYSPTGAFSPIFAPTPTVAGTPGVFPTAGVAAGGTPVPGNPGLISYRTLAGGTAYAPSSSGPRL